MGISTHVLNATTGAPAVGVAVALEQRVDMTWIPVSAALTDADGRIQQLLADPEAGVYRLIFATEDYLEMATFYPEITITVRLIDPAAHYHVPLLLSPFAYSTYRGS